MTISAEICKKCMEIVHKYKVINIDTRIYLDLLSVLNEKLEILVHTELSFRTYMHFIIY